MVVTYTISSDVARKSSTGVFTPQVDVIVKRSCDMGRRDVYYAIHVIGDVATTITAIGAWIAADIAALESQVALRNAQDALKSAFDLAAASIDLSFDI